MVASNQRAASRAGIGILEGGGTAADAAIATAAALSVTEPASNGLGGDCFVLYYSADTRAITALNGSGRAARAMPSTPVPERHANNVTVPGAAAGWHDLHERHGRLPMPALLAPAIALAEDGFDIAPVARHFWQLGLELLRGPGAAALRVDVDRRFKNPDLARALRAVATGKDAFYRGEIAAAIVAAVVEAGGALSVDDLAAHTSTWDEPISTTYRGARVWECPPNGQGLVSLMALNLLEGFDVHAMDPLGADRLHLVAEALRVAFADGLAAIADPSVVRVPTGELLDKARAARRRAAIDPRRTRGGAVAPLPGGHDTVYFCVVDGDGNACSFIQSVYMGFGTGIVPAGLGFSLQNRGACFSDVPGHPNARAPGKRPYHTIIPALLTRPDGSLDGPFGVMGGFMQPQGHVQVALALIDDGLTPQAALDRPRIAIDPLVAEPTLDVEEGVSEAVCRELAARGHQVKGGVKGFDRVVFGRGQIIRRSPSGELIGGFDRRGDGAVLETP